MNCATNRRIRLVILERGLDRLAQQRVFLLRPMRDMDVGEQFRRLAEHDDAVADADRFFQLMGDQDRGRAAFTRQCEESLAQFRRGYLVEMTEGFVRQQDVRLHRESARDCHALAHAAGQFVRIGIGELPEAKTLEPGEGALALLVFGQADEFERKLGVVQRRAPGQQAVLLKHGRDTCRGNNRSQHAGFCRRCGSCLRSAHPARSSGRRMWIFRSRSGRQSPRLLSARW